MKKGKVISQRVFALQSRQREDETRTCRSRYDIIRELVDPEKMELRSNVSKDGDEEVAVVWVVVEIVFLVHEVELIGAEGGKKKKGYQLGDVGKRRIGRCEERGREPEKKSGGRTSTR